MLYDDELGRRLMESFVAFLKNASQIFQWWIVIAPWEAALRVRLGRRVTKLGAGVHLRIPFFDAIYKQSIRLRVCNLPTQTTMTQDRKPLTIGATIGYSVENIELLYQRLHHAEDTLLNLAMQALAEIVAQTPSAQLTPEILARTATDRLSFRQFGLKDVQVRITDFAFVRTYRFITDTRWGKWGDSLDLEKKHS